MSRDAHECLLECHVYPSSRLSSFPDALRAAWARPTTRTNAEPWRDRAEGKRRARTGHRGCKLGEQLKGRRQEMKIVYLSGYTADTLARHGVLNPGVVLIQKPFEPGLFLRTIRTMLDSKEGAPPLPDALGVGH